MQHGGDATHVVCDVGREEDVNRVVEHAVSTFGGFDTWVNNADAGISIFGRTWDVPMEDWHRMFATVYWGVVHGSLAARGHFRARGGAGAIVNVGSFFGDRAPPVQSTYASAKFAVPSRGVAPRLTDKIMEVSMYTSHQSRTRPSVGSRSRGLFRPGHMGGSERGTHEPHLLRRRSYYVQATKRPLLTWAALAGSGLALMALQRARAA